MKLSILAFDGITTLDAVGGYEFLSRLPGMETSFFARKKGIISADTGALGLVAWEEFEDVQSTDILYVPGGPGAVPLETDEAHLEKIRQLDATSTWTVGICNGVAVLAAAGILTGKSVTTNYFYRDRVAAYGANVVPDRYVRDGKFITGAGVSASLDAGLYLSMEIGGEALAKTLQLGIEYYPAPHFPEARPEDAPDMAKMIIQQAEQNGASTIRPPAFKDFLATAG
ncbi:MAG: DJ-1/PfpI family protein [Hyphomonas sp.]|nr:DJ-1/PfpI family protein [Hyphomonas sp.]